MNPMCLLGDVSEAFCLGGRHTSSKSVCSMWQFFVSHCQKLFRKINTLCIVQKVESSRYYTLLKFNIILSNSSACRKKKKLSVYSKKVITERYMAMISSEISECE